MAHQTFAQMLKQNLFTTRMMRLNRTFGFTSTPSFN